LRGDFSRRYPAGARRARWKWKKRLRIGGATEVLPQGPLIAPGKVGQGRGPFLLPQRQGRLGAFEERRGEPGEAVAEIASSLAPGGLRKEPVGAALRIRLVPADGEEIGFHQPPDVRVQAHQIEQPGAAALAVADDEGKTALMSIPVASFDVSSAVVHRSSTFP
jgi:hypothetical protein